MSRLRAILSKSAINNPHTASAGLWLADVSSLQDEEVAFFISCLSSNEVDRYYAFLRRERQLQFLLGRILVRFAVAELLGLRPDEVSLIEQLGNAPRLVLPDDEQPMPGFSISHSREWVGCAVSAGTLLGLDIESTKPNRNFMEIGRLAFHAEELLWLQAQTESERPALFYKIWSRREALFKLRSTSAGQGSTASLSKVNCLQLSMEEEHFSDLPHPAVSIAICSKQLLSELIYKECRIQDLFRGFKK